MGKVGVRGEVARAYRDASVCGGGEVIAVCAEDGPQAACNGRRGVGRGVGRWVFWGWGRWYAWGKGTYEVEVGVGDGEVVGRAAGGVGGQHVGVATSVEEAGVGVEGAVAVKRHWGGLVRS